MDKWGCDTSTGVGWLYLKLYKKQTHRKKQILLSYIGCGRKTLSSKWWMTLVFTHNILKGLHHYKYQPNNICSSLITLSNINSLRVFDSVKYLLFNLISTTLNTIPVSIKEAANKTVFTVARFCHILKPNSLLSLCSLGWKGIKLLLRQHQTAAHSPHSDILFNQNWTKQWQETHKRLSKIKQTGLRTQCDWRRPINELTGAEDVFVRHWVHSHLPHQHLFTLLPLPWADWSMSFPLGWKLPVIHLLSYQTETFF